MKTFSKPGWVLGGYAAALLVSCAVFYVYVLIRKTFLPDLGAMQGFGDSLLFVGLFGLLALIPTAVALSSLRSSEKFWIVFSILSLVVAASGLVAAVLIGKPLNVPWAGSIVGLLALLKVLGAPLFGLGFFICAMIAPSRHPRVLLVAATAVEFLVSVYAFVCLFIVGHWLI